MADGQLRPFATYDDLLARWAAGDPPARDKAEALILDASAYILARLPGRTWDVSDPVMAQNLTSVTCAMVTRALAALQTDAGYGVSQYSVTASPYTESRSYQNPTGDLYLKAEEKRVLGIGAQAVGGIRVAIDRRPLGGDDGGW